MIGGRSAMLQTFGEGLQCCRSSGGRSAMLQIFRGEVADLPGEGLQGGRSAIQQRLSNSPIQLQRFANGSIRELNLCQFGVP